MLRQKAINYFLGKRGYEKLNCAESIVAADEPVDAYLLDESANYGGGRAPGGWCGPAFIASRILGNESLVERNYAEYAGSVKCVEIRQEGRMECVECVGLGADLIEKNRKLK